MAYYDQIFGIGKGDAQVLHGNAGIDALRQQYAQDRARRAAEDKELSAELAKVNYDGARAEDINHFTDKYAQIKALHNQVSNLSNSRERAQAKAELQGKMRQFSNEVAQSKTEGQTLADFGKDIFANRDNYADDAYDKYKNLKGTSTFDPKYHENAENFVTNAKANKFNSDKFLGEIEPNAVEEFQGGIKSRRIAGGQMNYRLEGKQVNKDKLFKSIDTQLAASPSYRRGIKEMFPDAKDPIEAVTKYKEYAYGLLNGKHKPQEKTVNTQMDLRSSPMSEFERYKIKHGLLKADGDYMPEAPQNKDIVFGDGKKTRTTKIDNYLGVSIPNKNFANTTGAISANTGKPVKSLTSSDKYSIVGVGNVKVVSNNSREDGSLAQSGFSGKTKSVPMVHVKLKGDEMTGDEDYFIPFDNLPINIKHSKSVREALKGFTPANHTSYSSQHSSSPNKSKKTINGF